MATRNVHAVGVFCASWAHAAAGLLQRWCLRTRAEGAGMRRKGYSLVPPSGAQRAMAAHRMQTAPICKGAGRRFCKGSLELLFIA